MGFVFAAAGCDRPLYHFVAQTRGSLVTRLFFCFRLFYRGIAASTGIVDKFVFRFSLVFDHFQYLASIGPLALAGAGLARASDILHSEETMVRNRVLCAGLLLILGTLSWQRTWVFAKPRDTLDRHAGQESGLLGRAQ